MYCLQVEIVGLAVSGVDGLDHIEELQPDTIFPDVHMSDMDGFSVLDLVCGYSIAIIDRKKETVTVDSALVR
jgi:YesN/AraC family two-component response regulator